jgi:hypothetical protein
MYMSTRTNTNKHTHRRKTEKQKAKKKTRSTVARVYIEARKSCEKEERVKKAEVSERTLLLYIHANKQQSSEVSRNRAAIHAKERRGNQL